ncbi:FimD/PapC N-terminal domain-containing protein [Candidatus Symbiopectobacterium sp. 'North America']|uniref:FimD/PapC N-terminal domain-containing protein n=1 Tax=Candidatus Symbiopectobacterium sp. 'North America' TaxID=2794574 RepID=UPI002456B96C|nr:FimD/PapC N-terminal domain-containing protein [Candidatus Symbiopectobacterium sp. 'North America']
MLHFDTISNCAKLTKLSALIYLCTHTPALLAEDYFSPDFIETRENIPCDIDLSRFSKTDGQLPGIYHVDVYLNEKYIESRDISFIGNMNALAPVLTPADFVKWGVKSNAKPDWMTMVETDNVKKY